MICFAFGGIRRDDAGTAGADLASGADAAGADDGADGADACVPFTSTDSPFGLSLVDPSPFECSPLLPGEGKRFAYESDDEAVASVVPTDGGGDAGITVAEAWRGDGATTVALSGSLGL